MVPAASRAPQRTGMQMRGKARAPIVGAQIFGSSQGIRSRCPDLLNFGPVNCPNLDPGSKYHVRSHGVRKKASQLPSARHAGSIRKSSGSRELDTAPISAAVCSPISKLRERKLYGACRLRRGASCSHFVAPCYFPLSPSSLLPPRRRPRPSLSAALYPPQRLAAKISPQRAPYGSARQGMRRSARAPCTGFPALACPSPRRTRPRRHGLVGHRYWSRSRNPPQPALPQPASRAHSRHGRFGRAAPMPMPPPLPLPPPTAGGGEETSA